MSNKAVEFIITEYKDHNLVHFKMVREDIKRQDVKDFLDEFLKMITKFKADGVKYYGLWQMNLTTVLPPTYIKIITDFMPQIREVGAEVNLGSAIVFKSGTIILVDDTNWEEPREATMEFIIKNSNKYRVLQDLKCKHARHPTYWNGLIIFKKI